MYLTGFADEAGLTLNSQIRAMKELNWSNIEARNIDGVNIHDLGDKEFDDVSEELEKHNIKINCFGSTIANWSENITDDFEITLAKVRRAIPRMKILGTELVRIMSYAVLAGKEPDEQMEDERFRRLREIVSMFTDAAIIPVHENCMNYGGMSWKHTLKLVENVPGLALVFDTGNPVCNDDLSKSKPYPKQSSWEFYENVKEHIKYVHIKDGFLNTSKNEIEFTWPGHGSADVYKILKDLILNGYDGGISIEPHMACVFHDDSVKSSEEEMFNTFVEYGRKTENMIDEIKIEAEKL